MKHAPIRFLPLDVALLLHHTAIRDQGGDPSVRDMGLLQSALGMPSQQFSGEFLHPDIPSMAAAYAFHICKNHPFVDGNKRTAFAAMVAFLVDNGWAFEAEPSEAERMIISVAAGLSGKADLTEWVHRHSREKRRLDIGDLFRSLTPEHLLEMSDGMSRSSKSEHDATIAEACRAIPIMRHLDSCLGEAADAGDTRRCDRLLGAIMILTAVYRIAEDQGYEW